ncbi:MAG: hypothetical protein ABII01_02750 [Candidatus Woesearchaeota archaeon]
MAEIKFKEKFIERYSKLTDFEKFKEYSLKYLRRSIRVNTLKISVDEIKKGLKNSGNWSRYLGARKDSGLSTKAKEKIKEEI